MKKIITLSLIVISYMNSIGQQINNGLVSAYYFTGGSFQQAGSSTMATADPDIIETPFGAPSSITISRTPQTVADRFGNADNALNFDFTTIQVTDGMGFPMDRSYATALTIPSSNIVNGTYTYSLWYKITDGSASSAQYLLSIGNDGGDQTVNYYGTSIQGHTYYQDPYSTGGPLIFPVTTLSTASLSGWNHFVSVRTEDSLKIYLNGNLIDKVQLVPLNNGGPAPFYGFSTIKKAIIGARYNLTGGYTGLLDDVRIFNRALSNAEVLQEYNYSATNAYVVTSMTEKAEQKSEVSIYPNPAYDKLTIQGEGIHEYILFSPEGLVVRTGTSDIPVELSGLESGIYFMKINNTVKKIIIR